MADALLRVTLLKPELRDYNISPINIEKIPVHYIIQTAPASLLRLQELHETIRSDPTVQLLPQVIHKGWPKRIRACLCSIQSYWYFRD